MKFFILFMATFWVVLALGLQSLNVNGGYRLLACLTSFVIGGSNLVILKIIPGPTEFIDCAAYLAGGPVGILTAMWLHPRILTFMKAPKRHKEKASIPLAPVRILIGDKAITLDPSTSQALLAQISDALNKPIMSDADNR
ncbi:hypothetical protein ACIPLR_17620 [Herbaspirillum huttiense]|jgi:hypothetical protein|uniref:hypothetical protein n=1 Tax=Herbaspirillum huttiense TaxID=863372 RepID=UPI00382A1F04